MAVGTMTDRPPTAAQPQASPSASREPARGSARVRSSHPLLGAFPLAVMTLATFLVLFTLMMARLTAGADPALRAGGASSLVETASGGSPLRTRASGGGASAATAVPVAASEGSSSTSPAVVTRSSGAASAGVSRDD